MNSASGVTPPHPIGDIVSGMFELVYFGLGGVLALLLLVTATLAVRGQRVPTDPRQQTALLAICFAACGLEVALITGVILDALKATTGDVFFQVTHFPIFYAAFAIVLYGAEKLSVAFLAPSEGRDVRAVFGWIHRAIWSVYGVVTAVALFQLVSSATYFATTGANGGRMPQQVSYFYPIFLALAVSGFVGWSMTIRTRAGSPGQRALGWFGAFALAALIGTLREATVIPSSGDPVTDVAVAFGPFVAAGLFLFMSLRAVLTEEMVERTSRLSPRQ